MLGGLGGGVASSSTFAYVGGACIYRLCRCNRRLPNLRRCCIRSVIQTLWRIGHWWEDFHLAIEESLLITNQIIVNKDINGYNVPFNDTGKIDGNDTYYQADCYLWCCLWSVACGVSGVLWMILFLCIRRMPFQFFEFSLAFLSIFRLEYWRCVGWWWQWQRCRGYCHDVE